MMMSMAISSTQRKRIDALAVGDWIKWGRGTYEVVEVDAPDEDADECFYAVTLSKRPKWTLPDSIINQYGWRSVELA